MDPPPSHATARPVWAKRRENVEAKNDSFFVKARQNDNRPAPTQWKGPAPYANTSDKEKPLAGHTRAGTFKPRSQVAFIQADKSRAVVGKDRTTGVTKADVRATGTSNERFFDAAKSQEIYEKARVKK